MIIRANSVNYTFSNPLYGYKTIINLGIKWQKLDFKSFTYYDYGILYTARACQFSIALNKTEFNSFIDVFRNENKGRGINISITPGGGFFPFGADRGDLATFKARLVSINQGASIGFPQDVFRADCEIIFNDPAGFPAYTPPVPGIEGQKAQGVLQIGTIENLRYPPNMNSPDFKYKVNTTLTYDGTPDSNDSTINEYISELQLLQNQSKTAQLINYLVNTVRANDVEIIPPDNSYMFGIENNATATYICKMLNEKIEITHEAYNLFSFNLRFLFKSMGE